MPDYSAPPALDRQENGWQGTSSGRGRHRPAGTRAFHLSISVLPVALMACLGVAAVVTVLSVGAATSRGQLVLYCLIAVAVVVLAATAIGSAEATRRARRTPAPGRQVASVPVEDWQHRLVRLRSVVAHGRQELYELGERLAAGEIPARRNLGARPATEDTFALLEYDVREGHAEAWNLLVDAASARPKGRSGGRSAEQVEVFVVNLARRMQTLSYRAIQGLDGLENQVEDPDLLKGLFRVDHLNTRMRRQAESLAVIGGAASRRRWTRPVTVYEVLRSAIAEVEHYNRVKVAPPIEGTLDGGAVADTVHLLAELVENATKFAPPQTQVIIRAESVTAGLAIEIEDRGLGIPRENQRRLNDLLADPERIDTYDLLQDGRIGLLVVSALAHRHGIVVRLQTNIYGGTQAIVVIPRELIGAEQDEFGDQQAPAREVPDPASSITSPQPAVPAAAPPAPAPAQQPAAARPVQVPASPVQAPPLPVRTPAAAPGPAQEPVRTPAPAAMSASGDGMGGGPGEPPPSSYFHRTQAPAPTGRRADVPREPAGNGGPSRPEGPRPALPRRRAQTHMAAELLAAPAPSDDNDDDGHHNTGMFAAFRQGMRSAQEEPGDEPVAPTDGSSHF